MRLLLNAAFCIAIKQQLYGLLLLFAFTWVEVWTGPTKNFVELVELCLELSNAALSMYWMRGVACASDGCCYTLILGPFGCSNSIFCTCVLCVPSLCNGRLLRSFTLRVALCYCTCTLHLVPCKCQIKCGAGHGTGSLFTRMQKVLPVSSKGRQR